MNASVFRRALAMAPLAAALFAAQAAAKVVRVQLDDPKPLASTDPTIVPYETMTGHAFGELDPRDPRNAIIQDIDLAPVNKNGKVEYEVTFQIVKPVEMRNASGLMWHDVPNRGGRITIVPAERKLGDVGLSSG